MSRRNRRRVLVWAVLAAAAVLVVASSAWAATDGSDTVVYLPVVSGSIGPGAGPEEEGPTTTGQDRAVNEASGETAIPGDGDLAPAPPVADTPAVMPEDTVAAEEVIGPDEDPTVFDSSTLDLAAPVGAAGVDSVEAWTHTNAYIQNAVGVGTETPAALRDIDVYKNRNSLVSTRVMNPNTGTGAAAEYFVTTATGKGVSVKQYGAGYTGTYMGRGMANWSVIRSESSGSGLIVAAGGQHPLILGANDVERMRITYDGKVGIGTQPSVKLHVLGNRIRLQNGTKILDLRADGASVDVQSETDSLFLRSTGAGHNLYINTFSNDGDIYAGHGGGKLDLWGDLRTSGYAPVYIRRYENIGNSANFSTGMDASTWSCTIGGWSGEWDIDENYAGRNYVWTYTSAGYWYLAANFYSHNNDESLDIDLVCFHKQIVQFYPESLKSLFDPD